MKMSVCDFCSSPATSTITGSSASVSRWHVCADCNRVIDAKDWRKLTKRTYDSMVALATRIGCYHVDIDGIHGQIAKTQAVFRHSVFGDKK